MVDPGADIGCFARDYHPDLPSRVLASEAPQFAELRKIVTGRTAIEYAQVPDSRALEGADSEGAGTACGDRYGRSPPLIERYERLVPRGASFAEAGVRVCHKARSDAARLDAPAVQRLFLERITATRRRRLREIPAADCLGILLVLGYRRHSLSYRRAADRGTPALMQDDRPPCLLNRLRGSETARVADGGRRRAGRWASPGNRRAANIVKEFHTEVGVRRVLDGISFEVGNGRSGWRYWGRNGAGKIDASSRSFPACSGRPAETIRAGLRMSWAAGPSPAASKASSTGYDKHPVHNEKSTMCRFRSTYDFVGGLHRDRPAAQDAGAPSISSGMRMRLAFLPLSLAIDFRVLPDRRGNPRRRSALSRKSAIARFFEKKRHNRAHDPRHPQHGGGASALHLSAGFEKTDGGACVRRRL